MKNTINNHVATDETRGHLYEYCACGAVRTRISEDQWNYDAWHICRFCGPLGPCTVVPKEEETSK